MVEANTAPLTAGILVRLKGDTSRFGLLQDIISRGGRQFCRIRFPDGIQQIPTPQVEALPGVIEEPLELLADGRFSEPRRLRQVLAHVRLTGRLADMVYSMEATNTEFYPYQFKPVLKILSAPTNSLLIADEVGLGKTIEAGLIWTELRARFGYGRLLVVCPKVLCGKWQTELSAKFGLEARIFTAAELLSALRDEGPSRRNFVAIASLQSVQPPRGWDDEASEVYSRPAAALARYLDEHAEQEPVFDVLVIDEAHHLRNPETQRNRLGRLLQPLAHHRLFLSATPIHLRSRDLFSLLSLLDPDTFHDETALEQIVTANRPLIAARDAIVRGANRAELIEALDVAGQHPLLQGAQQLAVARQEVVAVPEVLSVANRAHLAQRLESINLLANVINRTRRRDVQELRVLRDVRAYFADMTVPERDVYDRVTAEVATYAAERATIPGFLLATAERLLASSIPAAVAHWSSYQLDPGVEDEDIDAELSVDANVVRPLVERLARLCTQLPRPEDLERHDSKFDNFLNMTHEYLTDQPGEKLVVFSTFRATLHYLARRLSIAGLPTVLIHGGVTDRDAILTRFAEDSNVQVLLSSEVGSEGIDLQFCRAVVNYDLPWNPMRIEQRIGRIDRLGQKAQTISVINLLHRNTIDERIFDRLYARLGLIKGTLGDFEELLGDEIRAMTTDLLKGRLSPEQQALRIDQASQAIENVRQQTVVLEEQAASLIAHGDAVLRAIGVAHANHRFIGARDLAMYLSDSLGELFPGCIVHERHEGDLYDIQLTQEARLAYSDWLDERRLPSGGLLQREFGPVLCRLGRPTTDSRRRSMETVTQSHPLVRFVSSRVTESDAPRLRPAVAARVARGALRASIPLGRYAVLACLWRFGGQIEQERITYAGVSLHDGIPMDDVEAEQLALATAEQGTVWYDAVSSIDSQSAAELCRGQLLNSLAERFTVEEELRQAEQTDRVTIQLRTLEQRYMRDRTRLEETIRTLREQRRRESLIAATEGRLRALTERVGRRRTAIRATQRVMAADEQFAALLVEVI